MRAGSHQLRRQHVARGCCFAFQPPADTSVALATPTATDATSAA